MRTNFHIHTTYSDGVLTPAEAVRLQCGQGIEALSITDHDQVGGLPEAAEECERLGIKFVTGIELSSYGKDEIHILGYNIDYLNPEFTLRLEEAKLLRSERIKKIIEKLDNLGVKLNLSDGELSEIKGRVHIAKHMIGQGYVLSINEAFDKFLGSGKPAHIEGNRLPPFKAVQLIKDFGGVPVLAHPIKFLQDNYLNLLIEGLIPYGLKGLECYYATHNETETKNLLEIAAKYRLYATGGTDFHCEGGYISSSYENDKIDIKTLNALGIKQF